jgi:hypothetical protein
MDPYEVINLVINKPGAEIALLLTPINTLCSYNCFSDINASTKMLVKNDSRNSKAVKSS